MKELKGKAKIDFNKWMKPNPLEHGRYGQLITNTFDNMPFALQSGVILEWLDSVGVYIIIEPMNPDRFKYELWTLDNYYDGFIEPITRQEALKEAIKKAVEIYNKD